MDPGKDSASVRKCYELCQVNLVGPGKAVIVELDSLSVTKRLAFSHSRSFSLHAGMEEHRVFSISASLQFESHRCEHVLNRFTAFLQQLMCLLV